MVERSDNEISVVIPAFNSEQYVAMAIASVRAQTVAAAEIIVVDDGSTDATVAVARAAGVRVIEQTNAGVSAARNRGIAAASHRWVALLDSDDLWEADKLERQLSSLQATPSAVFSFCDFSQFDERGVRNESVLHEVHQHFGRVVRQDLGDQAFICDRASLDAALLVQNVIQPSALVIQKETAQRLGAFDLKLLACQDYDFMMRLTRDHSGTYIDRPLVRYRRHAKATTSNIPKSREGLAGVALRALMRPWEYSPETVRHFRNVLPSLFLKCGFAHLRFGRPQRAREWLSRSLRERFSIAGAILYAVSYVLETRVGIQIRNRVVVSRK